MPNQTASPDTQRDPVGRLFRILAKIFGILFLVVGLALLAREIRFGRTAQTAPGVIVGVRVEENADGQSHYPVVEFTTREGQVVRFEGLATSPKPVAGTPVKVLYNRSKPEDARIDSFLERWLLPAVFMPIGLGMLLAGTCWRTDRVSRANAPLA